MGGEREKGDQIKNFYNVNRSKHRASDRLQKKSQISRDFQRQIHGKNGQFRGKIRDKFRWETIIKKANFAKNFLGKFRWKAIGFALISWTFLMKQNRNFANFFFFGGGGRWKWWANIYAMTTTTEASTTYKINVAFSKPAILSLKPPLALRSRLDLVFSRTRFFFIWDRHVLF